jgi:hypothetical protein
VRPWQLGWLAGQSPSPKQLTQRPLVDEAEQAIAPPPQSALTTHAKVGAERLAQ